jgi:hypothetical protein
METDSRTTFASDVYAFAIVCHEAQMRRVNLYFVRGFHSNPALGVFWDIPLP